jgi:hypothetical protein
VCLVGRQQLDRAAAAECLQRGAFRRKAAPGRCRLDHDVRPVVAHRRGNIGVAERCERRLDGEAPPLAACDEEGGEAVEPREGGWAVDIVKGLAESGRNRHRGILLDLRRCATGGSPGDASRAYNDDA